MVADTEYYDTLEISESATAADIKKAYRKKSVKYHPDKNRDDPLATEKFQKISEAYQVLSDETLRAKYDKFGKESAVPKEGFEDADEYFAAIFGGEAFVSYIGELNLLKDLMKSAELSEEQKKEEEESKASEEAKTQADTKETAEDDTPSEHNGNVKVGATSTAETSGVSTEEVKTNNEELNSTKQSNNEPLKLLHHDEEGSSATSDVNKDTNDKEEEKEQEKPKTKLEEHEEEVRKKKEETITALAKRLVERLSVLTESSYDEECKKSFEKKFEIEANTLKMESFGLDIIHTIGHAYLSKAQVYIDSQQFLGIPGFFSSVKAKGEVVMDTFRTVSSALDAQSTMQELQKLQEFKANPEEVYDDKTGEIIPKPTDEEIAELEKLLMGKVLNAAWHGSKYEIQSTLRDVCDRVLKDKSESKKTRLRRAESLALLGHVFINTKRTKVEQEEAQIFEELVAEATKKKQKK